MAACPRSFPAASLALILVGAGCGGATESSSIPDGGRDASGHDAGGHDRGVPPDDAPSRDARETAHDTGSDGGSSGCPTSPPTGGPCTTSGLTCEYGADPDPYCDLLWYCDGGTWRNLELHLKPVCPSSPACPTYENAHQGGGCPTETTCDYPQGTCLCTKMVPGEDPFDSPMWQCVPLAEGCPSPRPRAGSGCSARASLSCEYGVCLHGVVMTCVDGHWALDQEGC